MVNVNTPVENPVVRAMEALQENANSETEAAFFAAIKQVNFLMVVEGALIHDEPDADGKITIKEKSTISIPMMSDKNGCPLYFFFTDWASIGQWNMKPNQSFIIPYDQVPDMVLREDRDCGGFIINPSTHNFFMPKHIVAFSSNRVLPQKVEKGETVTLGEPADYPQELVDAVKRCLKSIREVKRAWLRLMIKGGEKSYLIIIEHSGNQSHISQLVGQAAIPHLKGMYVDITTYDGDFGKNAVKDALRKFNYYAVPTKKTWDGACLLCF